VRIPVVNAALFGFNNNAGLLLLFDDLPQIAYLQGGPNHVQPGSYYFTSIVPGLSGSLSCSGLQLFIAQPNLGFNKAGSLILPLSVHCIFAFPRFPVASLQPQPLLSVSILVDDHRLPVSTLFIGGSVPRIVLWFGGEHGWFPYGHASPAS
jgi:hypothetical protein